MLSDFDSLTDPESLMAAAASAPPPSKTGSQQQQQLEDEMLLLRLMESAHPPTGAAAASSATAAIISNSLQNRSEVAVTASSIIDSLQLDIAGSATGKEINHCLRYKVILNRLSFDLFCVYRIQQWRIGPSPQQQPTDEAQQQDSSVTQLRAYCSTARRQQSHQRHEKVWTWFAPRETAGT